MNYYNEFNNSAACWLRELIAAGLIQRGDVDERDIREVKPEDLKGYNQCHFFAGIGGWPYALRLAGVPDDAHIWTGSPPCQPFSQAGKQRGKYDERHLAPTFLSLVKQCKPTLLFGEQVSNAIKSGWLDDLSVYLEDCDYAVGAAVLPACSVGAPHKRERLFFGAVSAVVDAYSNVDNTQIAGGNGTAAAGAVGDRANVFESWKSGGTSEHVCTAWDDCQLIDCNDGKQRPVKPGVHLLVDGLPGNVDKLRGFGNAINPQIAAEFVASFIDSVNELRVTEHN